ncbi:MAG: PAS domain S-box protein, partial [Thermodesulfobacteriota bacterium]
MIRFNDNYRHCRENSHSFTPETINKMRLEAGQDLADRSWAGIVIVPIAFLIGGLATDFWSAYPVLFLLLGGLLIFSTLGRILGVLYLRTGKTAKRDLYENIFFYSCLGVSLSWGIFPAAALYLFGDDFSNALIIILLAGIGGGAMASFCIWRTLAYLYLLQLLLPVTFVAFSIGTTTIIAIGVALIFFMVFNLYQIKTWNRQYWQAMVNIFLLDENSQSLSSLNRELNREVHEHKRTAKHILIAKEKLQDIYNASPNGILIHDLRGRLLDYNQRMLGMFSIRAEEIGNLSPARDLSAPDQDNRILNQYWLDACKDIPCEFEWLARRPSDNSHFHIQINQHRARWGNQSVIISTIHDIEDKKQAQYERESALSSLAETQSYLQAILDHTSLPIYCKDQNNRYILANKQFSHLSATELEHIVGQTDYEIFPEEMADLFRHQDNIVKKADGPLEFEETVNLDDC